MKVMISMNAFKGSLSSIDANDIVEESFIENGFNTEKCYIADGGDGTIDVAVSLGSILEYIDTYDPLMRPIKAPIAWLGKTAIIEMAKASGLALLKAEEKNPLLASSYGTGLLIKYAITKKAEKIILGIGGSATVDAGLGILAALDFQPKDNNGKINFTGGDALFKLYTIDIPNIELPEIILANDVTNPLLGENGAAYVYGPQKGATQETVELLDKGLENFNEVTKKILKKDFSNVAGAGAAGGVGACALAYLKAQAIPGAELFMDLGNFNTKAKNCMLLLTGEGFLDKQTKNGKAPMRATKRFKSINPDGFVIGLGGGVEDRLILKEIGINSSFSIANRPLSIQDSISNAERLLKETSVELAGFLKWMSKKTFND